MANIDLREHNLALDGLSLIEKAKAHASQQISSAQMAIVNRRDHPTYGYTKGSIKSQIDRAEGMLALIQALEKGYHVFAPLDSEDEMTQKIVDLRRQLKEAK